MTSSSRFRFLVNSNSMSNTQRTMSDEIIECIIPLIQDPKDRSSISLVCKRWYELDRYTRRHVTIAVCYATTPQRLHNRFPNIESLKLKGKPRAAMFNLIPEDWGGYAQPWVDALDLFPRLNSLHFRRMIISDSDLQRIASVKGRSLLSLKLDKCSGFSTDGLVHVARFCRDMRTLFLEDSSITETSGEWLHQLALNNSVLESLNFYLTFLEKIQVEDLELLASNCPLDSVKIADIDLVKLVEFFRSVASLREFCGGSVGEGFDQYCNIKFPAQLTSVGLTYLGVDQVPILFPVGHMLRKLDLFYVSLNCKGHCDIIERCPNLEVLETTNVIGDQGLEVVSLTCRKLRRLRIERGADEQGMDDHPGSITQVGLIAVSQGCRELEYLAIYMTNITNEALARVGQNLTKLNDFRLVLLDRDEVTDIPLDNGVRALLQGCHKMQRFAFYIRQGGLTDIGLSYISQYGKNVRWMLLGYAGETDAGLLEFSKGCPNLQKLEMRACCFTERGLAIAATQLVSLRYMWVQGYRASQEGTVDLLEMARPFWNIELIPEDQYYVEGDNGQPVRVESPSQILAYYSLAGPRTDHPKNVYPLSFT